jgi:hypothetical protein
VTVHLPACGGSYTMRASADGFNYVNESNEGSNQRTIALNVY